MTPRPSRLPTFLFLGYVFFICLWGKKTHKAPFPLFTRMHCSRVCTKASVALFSSWNHEGGDMVDASPFFYFLRQIPTTFMYAIITFMTYVVCFSESQMSQFRLLWSSSSIRPHLRTTSVLLTSGPLLGGGDGLAFENWKFHTLRRRWYAIS